MDTGIVPEDWRRANISPIFKKGEKSSAANYRPVSLTSICSKILEHILVKHMLVHFETHNILKDCQHGFRSRRSCETQLVTFIQELADNMPGGGQTDVVLMDFSKAFDKVPHQRLMLKLNHYGVRGPILKWTENFLSKREQRVVLDGERSDYVAVRSGVPQGTVLGPLLFLVYINDLPEATISSKVRLFADDAVVYKKITSPHDSALLQEDLNRLLQCEQTWQMSFHPDKCVVMHITRARKNEVTTCYNLRGHHLHTVDSAPYLGVELDNKLNWSPHINKVTTKATRSLNFVRRNLRVTSQKVKESAYKSLVRPTLDYCCAVWNPHEAQHIHQLEMVQRRAARFVMNRYHNTSSVSSMLDTLGWESLMERRAKFSVTLMYKIVHSHVAIHTQPHFTPAYSNTRTQHTHKFLQVQGRTDYHNNSYFVRVIPLWNLLPATIAEAPSLDAFKARLASHTIYKF